MQEKLECCCLRDGELCYLWPWMETDDQGGVMASEIDRPPRGGSGASLPWEGEKSCPTFILYLYERLLKKVLIYYSGQTKELAQIKVATPIQISYLLKFSGQKKKEKSHDFYKPKAKWEVLQGTLKLSLSKGKKKARKHWTDTLHILEHASTQFYSVKDAKSYKYHL